MARPTVTLKLATSLDGKIALANGASEWITCELARHAGRVLRAAHDAICVGANTAHIDNPQLTTRISGLSDPARVIFDSGAKLSPASNLVQTARETPVILLCQEQDGAHIDTLKALGVTVLHISNDDAGLDVKMALEVLKRQNIDSLLVEGGGKLAASFIRGGFVDTIEWFRAPIILGADGRDCVGKLNLEFMSESYSFDRVSVKEIGSDLRETYQKKPL